MGKPFPATTHIVIQNDPAELVLLSETIERIGSEYRIAERSLIQLQVALDETVSNVIKYAWSDTGVHQIQIRIAVHDGEIQAEIIDDGNMFNMLTARQPEVPPAGQRPRPGGLGIHMTKQLVDRIEYVRTDNHNHTTLTKKCALAAPPREGDNDEG